MWIYPRTGPRIADPGVAAAVVRWTRGLVACLGPDPAPSPWGFVSGVRAQKQEQKWWWTETAVGQGVVAGIKRQGRHRRTARRRLGLGCARRGVAWRLETHGGVQSRRWGIAAQRARRAPGGLGRHSLRSAIARRGASQARSAVALHVDTSSPLGCDRQLRKQAKGAARPATAHECRGRMASGSTRTSLRKHLRSAVAACAYGRMAGRSGSTFEPRRLD